MAIEENQPIKCVYGYVTDVILINDEEEYYLIAISRERTLEQSETAIPSIPMEQTVEELSSLYGPPSALIGRRVRIEYTGRDYESGVARVVADITSNGGVKMNEIKSRGFRYAAP